MTSQWEDTWTCHICGEKRPDSKISVQKNVRTMPGTDFEVEENVRYCNDKAECTSAAPQFTFLSDRTPTVATRPRRAPGETQEEHDAHSA